MPLKRSLILILIFLLVFSSVASTVIYNLLQQYQKSITQQQIAEQMIIKVFERKAFAEEYLKSRDARPQTQWLSKQKEIRDLILENESLLNVAEGGSLLASINKELAASEAVFEEAVNLSSNPDISPELTTRLSSQLTIRAEETISYLKLLEEDSQQTVKEVLDRLVVLFSSIASLFFILLIASFWIIWRSGSQLTESNERFEFVARATNDAIYDWNIKTNSIWFGDGMYRLFNYTKDQVVQTLDWWTSKLHPEDKDRIDKQLEEALASSQDYFQLEYRFLKANGVYAQVIDRALLVRDGSGKAIRYIGVMQDVSKQKDFENELRSRTDEAERLNKIMINRELKMIELKQEIAKLKGLPAENQ